MMFALWMGVRPSCASVAFCDLGRVPLRPGSSRLGRDPRFATCLRKMASQGLAPMRVTILGLKRWLGTPVSSVRCDS